MFNLTIVNICSRIMMRYEIYRNYIDVLYIEVV